MNKLPIERQAQVVALLVEDMSIRAAVRATGVSKNTIVKMLADLGAARTEYMDGALQGLTCEQV